MHISPVDLSFLGEWRGVVRATDILFGEAAPMASTGAMARKAMVENFMLAAVVGILDGEVLREKLIVWV